MKTWILYQSWGLDLRSATVGLRDSCSSWSIGALFVRVGGSVALGASWLAIIVATSWRA